MNIASKHPLVTVKPVHHHGKQVIGIFFPYHPEVVRLVRKISDTTFSRTLRCWTTPYRESIEQEIQSALEGHATFDFALLRNLQSHKTCPAEYVALLVRMRYSDSTRKNYISQFELFINHFGALRIDELAEEHIKQYM